MERIDSLSNDKIKLACKIASSSRKRREENLFFLEGLRLCRDAVLTGAEIKYAFFSETVLSKFPNECDLISSSSQKSFVVSKSVENKLALTETPQGFYCLCSIKNEEKTFEYSKKYIALENIQDPSNLGAIIRTAEALGIDGAIVFGGSDIYNPKALRASMGSILRLPVFECLQLCDFLCDCKENGMKIYATTPDSKALKITEAEMGEAVICVIGNEGNGVSREIFEICEKITIPMLGRAESLNAATAAALTMWEMMREQGV